MSEPPTGVELKALSALHRLADKKFQDFLLIAPSDPAYEPAWALYEQANQDYWTYAQYLHTHNRREAHA